MTRNTVRRILAIDPFSRGVGFAVLEGPGELIDWGLKTTRTANSRKAVRAIETLIARFHPNLLALEDWQAEGARRCRRIEILLNLVANGKWKGLKVRLLSTRNLGSIGPLPASGTKYGRANLLADRFPELRAFLPPFRKPWMSEDARMSIFDAVAFGVASLPMAPATEAERPGR